MVRAGWDIVDGHRVLRLDSDRLRVGVDVDRGAHIFELVEPRSGVNLLYSDPLGLAGHLVGGWYELFPNAGPATVVDGIEVPNHGDVRDLGWQVLAQDAGSVRLGVTSTVFPLRIEKTVELRDATVLVTEVATNTGADPVAFLWGHHVTFGAPFVDGATISAPGTVFNADSRYPTPIGRVAPDRPAPLADLSGADGQRVDLSRFPPAPATEMLFAPKASAEPVTVANAALGVTVEIDWDRTAFPALWLWIENGGNQASPFNGRVHALAVEPQVSATPSVANAVADRTAAVLAPGEQRTAWVSARLTDG